MGEIKDITKIRTYKDFLERLQEIEKQHIDIAISYYKYCYNQDENLDFKGAKELIIEELEPIGLKPYKVTKELNLIFRFKKVAEAIVLIKNYGIDLAIYKK